MVKYKDDYNTLENLERWYRNRIYNATYDAREIRKSLEKGDIERAKRLEQFFNMQLEKAEELEKLILDKKKET